MYYACSAYLVRHLNFNKRSNYFRRINLLFITRSVARGNDMVSCILPYKWSEQ